MTLQFHTLIADMQPDLVLISKTADNQTLSSTGVDMLGYQGVVFFACALHGEIMTYGLKAQQDTDVAFGGAADLAGSNVAFATGTSTDGFAFLEIIRPLERYVRAQLVVPNVVTPNSVAIFALRYGNDYVPETNADGEAHADTAEGTA